MIMIMNLTLMMNKSQRKKKKKNQQRQRNGRSTTHRGTGYSLSERVTSLSPFVWQELSVLHTTSLPLPLIPKVSPKIVYKLSLKIKTWSLFCHTHLIEFFSSSPIFLLADNIEKKYSNGISNVRELEERGCIVLYGVDVKEMSHHFFLKTQRFDRIVYNFPHVGFLYPENSHCQIQ